MRTNEILVLMEYWSHCHECGAIMVTVPGGSICPHCGFELEEPEDVYRAAAGYQRSKTTTFAGVESMPARQPAA